MMTALRKVKQMASISGDGVITIPGKVINGIIITVVSAMLIGVGAASFSVWGQTADNTKAITNHETRIVSLEQNASKPDLLAAKLDATNKRLEDMNERLRETNNRLDALLGQRDGRRHD